MLAAAAPVPPPWSLATAATLGCAALLSCWGAVWVRVRGRRRGGWGCEGGVVGVAGVCVLADIALAGARVRRGDGQAREVLLWTAALVQSLGTGAVKVGVGVGVLRAAGRRWHRQVVVAVVSLTAATALLHTGTTLLFAGPITTSWRTTDSGASWALLHFVASALDALTTVLVALLPLPLLRPICDFRHIATLAAVSTPAAAATSAAVLRSYLLYGAWRTEPSTPSTTLTTAALPTLCSSIALTTALLAASLLSLLASLSTRPKHPSAPSSPPASPHFSHTSTSALDLDAAAHPAAPYVHPSASASCDTVVRRPVGSHAPSLSLSLSLLTLRFHDGESGVDFDIAGVGGKDDDGKDDDRTNEEHQDKGLETRDTQTPDAASVANSRDARRSDGGAEAKRGASDMAEIKADDIYALHTYPRTQRRSGVGSYDISQRSSQRRSVAEPRRVSGVESQRPSTLDPQRLSQGASLHTSSASPRSVSVVASHTASQRLSQRASVVEPQRLSQGASLRAPVVSQRHSTTDAHDTAQLSQTVPPHAHTRPPSTPSPAPVFSRQRYYATPAVMASLQDASPASRSSGGERGV
ncbi:hypothetical protein C7974DRAFT_447628 [Boeremia exigua]|uniref:uncharacterized protein n=1 Tax=Boeremia exigua TaxID=749465 RepID=UPI001E8ED4BF|nr:uncharacterized protein C7974DRAFT_447628 [Boeremia exigua]KAH6642808.1 hypothetical protein C7974DRAFT_447628 [Boeremia exigua]